MQRLLRQARRTWGNSDQAHFPPSLALLCLAHTLVLRTLPQRDAASAQGTPASTPGYTNMLHVGNQQVGMAVGFQGHPTSVMKSFC